MPKLYFKFGTVNSSKSMRLLATAYSYLEEDKKILLMKPYIDTKYDNYIGSRAISEKMQVDYILETPYFYIDKKDVNNTKLTKYLLTSTDLLCLDVTGIDCIFVDEVQFLSRHNIEALYELSNKVSVICYGLLTNFKTELFEGSKRLLELCEDKEEIKTVCYKCNKKAIFSCKIINGKHVYSGDEIEISHQEIYKPVCKLHYK